MFDEYEKIVAKAFRMIALQDSDKHFCKKQPCSRCGFPKSAGNIATEAVRAIKRLKKSRGIQ
jgi:hypothetical protein